MVYLQYRPQWGKTLSRSRKSIPVPSVGYVAYITLLRHLPSIHQLVDLERLKVETRRPPYITGWMNEKPLPSYHNLRDDAQDAPVATATAGSKTASDTRKSPSASRPLGETHTKKDLKRNNFLPDIDVEKQKCQQKEAHKWKEQARRDAQKKIVDELENLLSKRMGYKLDKGTRNTVLERSVDAIKEFWDLLTALWVLLPELTRFQKHCKTLDSANLASASALERVLGIVYSHPNVLTPPASNVPSPVSFNVPGSPFACQKGHPVDKR